MDTTSQSIRFSSSLGHLKLCVRKVFRLSNPEEFKKQQSAYIENFSQDAGFRDVALNFFQKAALNGYTYVWDWMGLPVIQYPNDLLLMQEVIWKVRPTVIIETGVARGGSLAFYASMLKIVSGRKVIGIDILIHKHNRDAIERHELSEFITLIEGDSTSSDTVNEVRQLVSESDKVLVVLDSDHTHNHVLNELNALSNLVSIDSYCVVFDTTCDQLSPAAFAALQPSYVRADWSPTRNPGTAVSQFLEGQSDFVLEKHWHEKAMVTNCWNGFLRRSK